MITKHDGLTVSEFVKQIKDVIDHHPSFNNVTLIGELSNFKAHTSGHFYFTLKDEGSRINCVMFRSQSQRVLFRPKDGDKVIVSGRVELYEQAGTIQLYASRMNLDGLGDLHIRFEALKKRFFEEGLFDVSHKKTFPKYPKKIAVIVGAGSAAYHDIDRTLKNRWPLSEVEFKFSAVQGKEAIEGITQRIQEINTSNFDAIILARGGGSIEDLWAFNEEAVVYSIYNSRIPVICGVGHESDTTLSDYVSDLRAATPTAAVVTITPDIADVRVQLRNYKNNSYLRVKTALQRDDKNLKAVILNTKLGDPIHYIERKQMVLDILQSRIMKQVRHFEGPKRILSTINIELNRTIDSKLNKESNELNFIENKLTIQMQNRIQKDKQLIKTHDNNLMSNSNFIIQRIGTMNQKNSQLKQLNETLVKQFINLKKQGSIDIIRRISTNNPMEKLVTIYERGFAGISKNGTKITSVNQLNETEDITIQFKDGLVNAKVIGKESTDGNI